MNFELFRNIMDCLFSFMCGWFTFKGLFGTFENADQRRDSFLAAILFLLMAKL